MGPTPYCSWLSRDGMVARFRLVCESAERLIIFYDVPGRTGLHIEMDTYRRLAVCLVLLDQTAMRLSDLGSDEGQVGLTRKGMKAAGLI